MMMSAITLFLGHNCLDLRAGPQAAKGHVDKDHHDLGCVIVWHKL